MKVMTYLLITVWFTIISIQPLYAQDDQNTTADSSETVTDVSDSLGAPAANDSLQFTRPWHEYQTYGRRDPFESLVPKQIDDQNKIKQLFPYENSTVLGIVHSEDDTHALVMDNAKKSYVLRVGDQVIGGQVSDITDTAVYLHIVKYGRPMNIVMRMVSSRYTVIEESDGVANVKKPGINVEYEQGPLSTKGVIIEEVTVPLGEVRTVEEEWFGTKDPIYEHLMTQDSIDRSGIIGAVMLIEPQREVWIRLPYIMDWTGPEDVINYTLTIDDTPDFSSPLMLKEELSESSFLLNSTYGLPQNRDLFWKVDAIDRSGGRYECKPDSMSFKIIGQ